MNINPVLLKELKVRMRGWRAAGIVFVYLAVLAMVSLLMNYTTQTNIYGSTIDSSYSIGVYTGLAVIQFLLILFVAPALTAGAISGEREKQTLDLVLVTKLSPRSIVTGKLIASISQVILLVVASLPIVSTVFLFGGITIKEMLQLFGFYIMTAIMVGSIGLFFSSYVKRTTAATVLTYGTIVFLCFGTLFIAMFYIRIFYQWSYQGYFPLFHINPLVGFSSLLSAQFGGFNGGGFNFIPGMHMADANAATGTAPWIINTYFNIGITALMLILSAIKVNPVKRSIFYWLKRRKTDQKVVGSDRSE